MRFDYRCTNGHVFELAWQLAPDQAVPPLTLCPQCGEPAQRVWSPFTFVVH